MRIIRLRHFLLLFVILQLLANDGLAETRYCGQAIESAVAESQAIFLGRAVEERVVPMASKGGTNLSYKEVKFEVSRSWKLVDSKSVWVRIPAKTPGCGYDGLGRQYLVYANRLNDLLYVSPASRTMPAENATEDIEWLGTGNTALSDSEFILFRSHLILVLIILAAAILICIALLKIYRRPMPNA